MPGDASYQSVSLLLHCNGTDGSTTFTDTSPAARTVTAAGNAHVETDQQKWGTASAAFDGTGDYLSLTLAAAIGTGDFTIEAWAYFSSMAALRPIGCLGDDYQATGMMFGVTTAGRITCFGNNASIATGSTETISTNTWTHLAWSRSGTSLKLFVNGVQDGSATNSANLSNVATNIGRELYNNATGAQMNGYLDDIRITKGVARYTTGFTPPAAEFPDWAGQIAGTVLDDAGDPVARVVRAYRRDTGALVGNTTSSAGDGGYSMNILYPEECTVICLDDAAGDDYNDLVFRVTPA